MEHEGQPSMARSAIREKQSNLSKEWLGRRPPWGLGHFHSIGGGLASGSVRTFPSKPPAAMKADQTAERSCLFPREPNKVTIGVNAEKKLTKINTVPEYSPDFFIRSRSYSPVSHWDSLQKSWPVWPVAPRGFGEGRGGGGPGLHQSKEKQRYNE